MTEPAERAATVLSQADVAMYVAKTRGKNRYEVYDEAGVQRGDGRPGMMG